MSKADAFLGRMDAAHEESVEQAVMKLGRIDWRKAGVLSHDIRAVCDTLTTPVYLGKLGLTNFELDGDDEAPNGVGAHASGVEKLKAAKVASLPKGLFR